MNASMKAHHKDRVLDKPPYKVTDGLHDGCPRGGEQDTKSDANDLPMMPMRCQVCHPYHFCVSIICAEIAVQCTCHYKACALLAWGLAGLRIRERHQNA